MPNPKARLLSLAASRVLCVVVVSCAIASGMNAGSARATLSCTFGGGLSTCNNTEGNLVFSNFTLGTGYDPTAASPITIDNPFPNFYRIKAFYNPDLAPGLGSGSFSFTASASPGYRFKLASIDSSTSGLSGASWTFTNTISGLTASPLISANGSNIDNSPFPSGVTSTNVTVSWAGNGSIVAEDSVITFEVEQVPGPLPILGAASAFGFSRRLHRRVKARS